MTAPFRQIALSTQETGTSFSVQLTGETAVLPGSLLVLAIECNLADAVLTVSDSVGDTIAQAVALAGNASGPTYQAVYYVKATAGNAQVSFSVTSSVSATIQLVATEYTGSWQLDQASPVATGSDPYPTTANLTPVQTGELAVSYATCTSSFYSPIWSSPWTEETPESPSDYVTAGDQVLDSTTALSGTCRCQAGEYLPWSISLLLFKPATAARVVISGGHVLMSGGHPVITNSLLPFAPLAWIIGRRQRLARTVRRDCSGMPVELAAEWKGP